MKKEMSIIRKLQEQREVKAGLSLNESTEVKTEAKTEKVEQYVGKKYRVVDAIPVSESEKVDKEQFLVVKESKEDNLEIEVRNNEDKIVGLLKATNEAFAELISDKKIEAVKEGLIFVAESKEEKVLTEAVDFSELANAIAEEDFESAEALLDELPEGTEIGSNLVSAVVDAGVEEADAEALVNEFFDYLNDEEELEEAFKKVVRDGKVVTIQVRKGVKRRMSAKQKAALAKARKKSHTGAAQKSRNKSMKVRKRKFGEALEMLDNVRDTIAGYGLNVLDADAEMTNESVNLELVLENTSDNYEINLSEMEAHFAGEFNGEVEIPDVKELTFEGKRAVVLNLLVK